MLSLPALKEDITVSVVAGAQLTAAERRPLEPVGRHFLQHATRTLRNHTWSEFEKIQAAENVQAVDGAGAADPDELLFDTELADETLLEHDARDWKTADLYAAMGLSQLRYRATDVQIVKAHRKQVVKYHPDKQSAAGAAENDAFFKIIQKAFETLTDRTKRMQYDSCDFVADVEPPVGKPGAAGYDFFEAWAPVFASEARFSKKQPVPELGDDSADQKTVEAFYGFWHRFDSWRTFEFLDEDVPDDSSNRDHKRYIERKNKAARDKKKTADNARLVKLVERAMNEDPRIRRFKEEAKKLKEQKKWDREAGARAEAAAKEAAEREAAEKAALEAEQAAAAKMDKKKLKEAAKAAKKKNKRALRNAGKDNEYFGDAAADHDAVDAQIALIVDTLSDDQLAETVAAVKQDAKQALQTAAKNAVDTKQLTAALVSYFI